MKYITIFLLFFQFICNGQTVQLQTIDSHLTLKLFPIKSIKKPLPKKLVFLAIPDELTKPATKVISVLPVTKNDKIVKIVEPVDSTRKSKTNKINYTVPILITGLGMLLNSSSFHQSQLDWHKENVRSFTTEIDDYLSLTPNIAVFGLGLLVKPKHDFKDRMLIATMANSIMMATTYGLKYSTNVLRPDGTTRNSFPSGHTALAFTGAQIMHEEYGQKSIFYSILGYSIASATGGLRVVNNRHWWSDVVAGAGIGMLSTKLAYRMLPWAKKKIYKKENVVIMPNYVPKGIGMGMVITLK